MAWNLEEAIAYYHKMGAPGDQTALIGLLRETQQENGGSIPAYIVGLIAANLGVKETLVLAIVKRIPSLRLSDTHCLEICSGPNCPKKGALAQFVEKTYGAKPEKFSLKYTGCMRLCGKGPNIKWDGKLYHRADEELIRSLVETI